jgi:photosystem II stability/assembly factor-like uncharacterized protein
MNRTIALTLAMLIVVLASNLTKPVQAQQNRSAIAARVGLTVEQLDRLEAIHGLGDRALAQIPPERVPMLLLDLQYPDLARRRAAFRLLQEVNESGQIPATALSNAFRQLDALRARVLRRGVAGIPVGTAVNRQTMVPHAKITAGAAAVPPTAGLNPDQSGWTWLGPGNIGGRTRALIVDPHQPSSIWAASVGGGVWHSTDAGASFAPVDDRMANLVVSSLVMDPTDSKKLCAGTGEGYYNGDALLGAGIFCTSDAAHWTVLSSTANPSFQYVNRLAVDSKGQVLVAATRAGLFRSATASRTVWTSVLSTEMAGVAFHPSDPQRAVASGLRNGTAYYSTDGGATWRPSTHPGVWQGRVELTYALHDPTTVYASVNNGVGEVWRSTDGGQTYERRNGQSADGQAISFLGAQGWYGNVIWAGDPTNSDFVIVGGIDLWKSTDGGNTFVDISSWWDDNSAHADQHVIVAHPGYDGTSNRTVYFGNDGGLFRADDVTTVGNDPQPPRKAGWARLDHDYGVTQFYGAAGSAATGTILGGTQDNGTVVFNKTSGPQQWTSMFGGDGGWAALDLTDEQRMYGEYVYLNVHRSVDGGHTAEFISGQYWDAVAQRWTWKPFPFSIPDAQSQAALFIAPFVLDPRDPNRLLAGGLDLWVTTDLQTPNTDTNGPRWRSIKSSVGSPISTIAISPADSKVVWVGHVNGDVYRSDNATDVSPTWKKLDDAGSIHLPRRYVTRIAIDPTKANIAFVTFGGFGGDNIWKTLDGGVSWSDVNHGLPQVPIRAVTVHPSHPGYIYIGSDLGVFASDDGGTTWSPTNEGPTSCSVEDLIWLGQTLVAVTHGRGLFAIPLM